MAGNVVYQKQAVSQKGPKAGTKTEKKRHYYDFSLLLGLVIIFAIGLLIIFSSSQYTAMIENGNPRYYLNKQLTYGGIGLAACILISKIPYRIFRWRPFAWAIYAGSVGLLLLTLVMGLASHGKTRWIQIGSFSFQPTEVAKAGLIMTMAYLITVFGKRLNKNFLFILVLVIACFPSFIVLSQNLSSGFIMIAITGIMLFIATEKYLFLGSCFCLILSGMFFAKPVVRWAIARSGNFERPEQYWLRRIVAWAYPEVFTDDAYQTTQGLYAIGSGGLTGRGLGESIQKFGKIPEVQNDMIFTVICEEFGFVGAVLIVLLYVFIIYRIYQIAKNAVDIYGQMICIGVMAHISVQVILNIAVVTGVIPNTGVTLPFISYGGTALMCTMAEIGLVLSVSNRIPLSE